MIPPNEAGNVLVTDMLQRDISQITPEYQLAPQRRL
jgi:hypothetical protein